MTWYWIAFIIMCVACALGFALLRRLEGAA